MRLVTVSLLVIPIVVGCVGDKPAPEPTEDATTDPDAHADVDSDASVPPDTGVHSDPDEEGGPEPSDSGTPASPDTGTDTGAESSPPPTCPLTHGIGEPLATRNECGTLSYGLFATEGSTDPVHRLPDFSFAGYRGGGVSLPSVPTVETIEPEDGDDRARIQAAIDAVSARSADASGHRGAVLLRAGTYEVGDTLTISTSGVVLRGEGQGADGTILLATKPEQHTLLRVQGSGSGLPEDAGTRSTITDAHVPIGSTTLHVADGSVFAVGDTVVVERTPNDDWVTDLGMDAFGWTADAYAIGHERSIVAIEGDALTVDIPTVDALSHAHGGGVVYRTTVPGRLEEVGIEDLRIVSTFTSATDEDHGWTAVDLRRTRNSWVDGVTAVHFGYSAVSVHDESAFNTVQEVAMLSPISQVTGGRRYAFYVGDGIGNLFQRCYSEESRHDFVTGSRTTGPNVWLDSVSVESTNDDGPHHRWSTGMLLDNVVSFKIHVENRQDSGSGHGWSGAQTLFWNTVSESIRADAPLGGMSWTIGSMGTQDEGGWAPEEPFGWWESHNAPVEPRSLYLQQLADRRGTAAVHSVTTAEQREGRIWGQLAEWAGSGPLTSVVALGGDTACDRGITAGYACCEAGCGECGGSGCGGRPGGAAACCTGPISTSGRSCQLHDAPCIIDPVFAPIGE